MNRLLLVAYWLRHALVPSRRSLAEENRAKTQTARERFDVRSSEARVPVAQ